MALTTGEDAAADGVVYLEVRFSPLLHRGKGLTMVEVLTAVLRGKEKAEFMLQIKVNFLLCGIRTMPESEVSLLAELTWRYRDRGVVGFDLAGAEAIGPVARYQKAFHRATQNMINVTIHAGEADGWKSVHDAVQLCGAQRVGHGCNMKESEQLMHHAAQRQVAVEVCVTSNMQTKAIPALDGHPVKDFLHMGIPCIPCVDNSVVSNTKLSDEYDLLIDTYDLSPANVIDMVDAGFGHCFANSDRRLFMRENVCSTVLSIMRAQGIDVGRAEETLSLEMPTLFYSCVSQDKDDPTGCMLLTEELLQQLPKGDCGCCLVGSVPSLTLLDEIQRLKQAGEAIPEGTEDIHNESDLNLVFKWADPQGIGNLQASLLQTVDQITRGVNAILDQAEADGVTYMEMVVRPGLHLMLEPEALIQTVQMAAKSRPHIKLVVIICFHASKDPPELCLQLAHMAANKQVGLDDDDFCVGIHIAWDGDLESLQQHEEVINLIKDKYIPCSLEASKCGGTPDLLTAMRLVDASRLIRCSGHLGSDPSLVDYLARRHVAVTLSWRYELLDGDSWVVGDCKSEAAPGAATYEKQRGIRPGVFPTNLVYHTALSTVMCSTFCTPYLNMRGGRGKALLQILAASKLGLVESLQFMADSFRRSFAPYAVRQALTKKFWDIALDVLGKAGLMVRNETSKHKGGEGTVSAGSEQELGFLEVFHARSLAAMGGCNGGDQWRTADLDGLGDGSSGLIRSPKSE